MCPTDIANVAEAAKACGIRDAETLCEFRYGQMKSREVRTVDNFSKLRISPTLRFVVFGAMSYTAVSMQGSLQALRTINETSHFTHYTIAHAHLGVYSFFTMMAFGAMYYVMPRLVEREWISSRLIKVHFWCCATGIVMYWVGLTIGGWLQGMWMNNPDIPFMDIVGRMIPYLWSRSIAGTLMTIGHFAFGILVWKMLRREGEWLVEPTLFVSRKEAAEATRQAAPAIEGVHE